MSFLGKGLSSRRRGPRRCRPVVSRRRLGAIHADGRAAADFPLRGRAAAKARRAGRTCRRGLVARPRSGAMSIGRPGRQWAGSPPKRPYTVRNGLLAMRCWGLSRLSSDVFWGSWLFCLRRHGRRTGWGGVIPGFAGRGARLVFFLPDGRSGRGHGARYFLPCRYG